MTACCFAFFTLFHLSLTLFRPEVPFKTNQILGLVLRAQIFGLNFCEVIQL